MKRIFIERVAEFRWDVLVETKSGRHRIGGIRTVQKRALFHGRQEFDAAMLDAIARELHRIDALRGATPARAITP